MSVRVWVLMALVAGILKYILKIKKKESNCCFFIVEGT